jgi:hypothetical protein
MDRISIQAQDLSGMWRTIQYTFNQPQRILAAMKSLQNCYPNYRVRAVDQNGRIVDIL